MTHHVRPFVNALAIAAAALCLRPAAAQSTLPIQWVYTPINAVQAVAYSPDGTLLAVGGQSGVQIFGASTGVLIRCLATACNTSGQFFTTNTGVNSIAFSPDSKTLAVGGTRFVTIPAGQETLGEVELWNVSTGALNYSLNTTANVGVFSVAFSPNGLTLADGGQSSAYGNQSDGQAVLELWNVNSGSLISSLNPTNNSGLNDNGIVNSVAFSPDGTKLASGGANGSGAGVIFLWNLSIGTVSSSLGTVAANGVNAVAFSPDGTTLADGGLTTNATTGEAVGVLELWNLSNSKLVESLATTANGGVESVAFSPNGKFIADGGANGNYVGVMEEWDVGSGTLATTFNTANRLVNSVCYSPGGAALADGGGIGYNPYQNGAAELWNPSDGTLSATLDTETSGSGVTSVALSPDGQTLVYVGNQTMPGALYSTGFMRRWSVSKGTLLATIPLGGVTQYGDSASAVAYSPDSSTLAVGGYNSNATWLELVNASTGEVTKTLNTVVSGGVTSVAFSPDGTILADCGVSGIVSNGQYNGVVELWSVATGKLIASLKSTAISLASVAFSPDGSTLADGGMGVNANENYIGVLELWNVSTGKPVNSLKTANSPGVAAVAFSPDGKVVADGGSVLEMWNTSNGKLLSTLPLAQNSGGVNTVAFTPDGEVLLAGTGANVQAFSASGYELLSYYINENTTQIGNFWAVSSIAVSTNGSILAYGSENGAAFVAANPFYDSVAISSLAISPQTVMGGTSAIGTVTLAKPAPAGGNGVILISGNTTVGVPGTVRVAPGATQGTFTITTETLSNNTTATVSASSDGVTVKASVNVSNLSVSGLSISPSTVQGGSSSIATITLSGPAPSGGIGVGLISNSASAVVPATVTIAGGTTSATFTVTSLPVNSQTTPVITAGSGVAAKSSGLTITPATLVSASVAPSTIVAGTGATGTLTLTGPAGPSGATVYLDGNSDAAIPSSVTIPQGQSSASFSVVASGVNAKATDDIVASLNGTEKSAKFTVTPASLAALNLAPSILLGGNISTGTITMNGPAGPNGVTIDLSSNSSAASVPQSVKLGAGQSEATFTVKTVAVSVQKVATITAKSGAVAKTASLTITGPTLMSVSLSPATVIGGASSTGTVTLSSVAGAGGVSVKLSSSSTSATVPASVTVPAGKTSATFAVKTKKVKSSTAATITGKLGNTSQTAILAIS